ncbi:MAG: hypothetical protein LBI62_00320 [Candidatus Accumulibacter sp.]|jgi:hypothetical protein|nr:hypothetical protein [Accumulibacter sp.]
MWRLYQTRMIVSSPATGTQSGKIALQIADRPACGWATERAIGPRRIHPVAQHSGRHIQLTGSFGPTCRFSQTYRMGLEIICITTTENLLRGKPPGGDKIITSLHPFPGDMPPLGPDVADADALFA